MEIEKLLDAASKREARQAIRDWLNSELRSEIRGAVIQIAKKWVNENRELIKKEFELQVAKQFPKVIGDLLKRLDRL